MAAKRKPPVEPPAPPPPPPALTAAEAKPTSGPWQFGVLADGGLRVATTYLYPALTLATVHDVPAESGSAALNGRLMAAAPEMLAALQAVAMWHDGREWTGSDWVRWARLTSSPCDNSAAALGRTVLAAIAKATGA